LNDRDEIVFVNEAWDAFAATNSAEHLIAAQVLGRPLWGFITDGTTQALYREVLARVRSGYPVQFNIRCDSPGRRRLLEINVAGGPGDVAEFRVRTIMVEERPLQVLLDSDRPHSEPLLPVCGWCKKVDIGGHWAEVEEAVSLLGLFERSLLPGVTHGICEDCCSRLVATVSNGQRGTDPGAAADGGA
jgi:hypothetical protein